MTVLRDSSPLMVFSHISLAIQERPSAHPVMNLKQSHIGTLEAAGMNISTRAAVPMPAMTLR
jgi:hypothetical protein